MSDFTIRDSLEVQFTKAPAIAIAGASGSGKTESAMRLARGYCGPGEKFVVIDTEEKRALYKKDRHQPWDWLDFQPPFTPERTWEVLEAVKGYKAVILDSASHEYAGEGGISDIAEDELERMANGDPKAMERLIAPSWKTAKRRHKRALMANLIRYPTLVICCLRAEPKVKFVKEKFTRGDGSEGEKNTIVDAGYQPICEKMFMYEMLASFMMYAGNAGVPEQVKALEVDLKPVFLDGEKIDEATGARLRVWSDGRAAPPVELVTAEQVKTLEKMCKDAKIDVEDFLAAANANTIAEIPAALYARAARWIEKKAIAMGPKPIEDEAVALRRIDAAPDDGAAAAILELCAKAPWYPRAVEAYKARFSA